MITPNKIVSLEMSAMGKIPILVEAGPTPISIATLWERVEKSFESIDEFLLAVDVLYVLGRVDVDAERGLVTYAD